MYGLRKLENITRRLNGENAPEAGGPNTRSGNGVAYGGFQAARLLQSSGCDDKPGHLVFGLFHLTQTFRANHLQNRCHAHRL